MESSFYFDSGDAFPGGWIPIESARSGRFCFFKARIHGRLHFVKTISVGKRQDLRTIEALRKEFEIGYNLDHPNIVKYLRYDNNVLYEEYIDGKNLRQMVDEGDPRLHDPGFIAKVCRQILEVIEYIHAHGVLHLDLKPENVMITRVGNEVKIIDFGCAYIATADTTQGATLQYKAPEQGEGETNAYTDIYLVGRIMEDLVQHSGLKSRWRPFIKKATSDNPSNRFKSEQDALAAIPGDRGKITMISVASILLILVVAIFLIKRQSVNDSQLISKTPVLIDSVASASARLATDSADSSSKSNGGYSAISSNQEELKLSHPSYPDQISRPKEDITRQLELEIINRISADYTKNIKPACPPDSIRTDEDIDNVQVLIKQAIARSIKFGDSLAAKYPEHAEFIHSKVYETINSRQSLVATWLYGH